MLDQPVPHATSATCAGGSARSRTSTSTIAGSHSRAKQVDEPGPVGLRPTLGLPWQRRWRVPNPKRLHQLRKAATGADDVDAGVGLVSDVVAVCQDGDVLRRQPVPASEWFRPRVVDDEQVTRGVVLEPLPHVPLGGSSACGQLRRGGRTAFCERPI